MPKEFTREKEIERLVEAIHNALKRKGSVLIPAFALGRTQEILALLALLMREGKLKPQPIFIGGLGRVFTEIYDLEAHRTHRQHTNLQLNQALNLQVLEKGQSENMKLTGGKIFVITAGMMSENTAADGRGREARDFLRGLCRPQHPRRTFEGCETGRDVCLQPQRGADHPPVRNPGF